MKIATQQAGAEHLRPARAGIPVVRRVAVLGAGVMGAQIAAHFANAGIASLLFDLAADGSDKSSTARNAGLLDIKMVPERHNAVKVLLCLDIGGSMDDHVRICEELFSAARSESGRILVFLPGASEIRQLSQRLEKARLGSQWIVAPLFGNLTHSAQNQAIAPPPAGRRKIVLSTSIAETSLTIEGIRIVVDSGLQRVPRFERRSGLTRLVTVPVSRA